MKKIFILPTVTIRPDLVWLVCWLGLAACSSFGNVTNQAGGGGAASGNGAVAGSGASAGLDGSAVSVGSTNEDGAAATCSICSKADACCLAVVANLYGNSDAAAECLGAYSPVTCNGLPTTRPDGGFLDGGVAQSAYISDCVGFLAEGIQLGLAACE